MPLQVKTKLHKPVKTLAATTPATAPRKPELQHIVLLIDDDENMPLLIGRALNTLKPQPCLHYANNSFHGQDYLFGRNDFSDRLKYPFPDLLILDLKLPLVDGFQFIEWARSQPQFKHLPILALSKATDPAHRTRALKLGANLFLVKPFDIDELVPQLKNLLGMS